MDWHKYVATIGTAPNVERIYWSTTKTDLEQIARDLRYWFGFAESVPMVVEAI